MKIPRHPVLSGSPNRLTRRAAIVVGVQAAVVGLLGWRMHDLGVRKSSAYAAMAEENRISLRLIPPARGLIFDRQGQVLARNRTQYKVDIIREQTIDFEAVLSRLATLIPIGESDLERIREDVARHRAFIPVTVANRLSWAEVSTVAANSPVLPGVVPGVGHERMYPFGTSTAHVVGYVGPVSDYDLKRIDDRDPLLKIPRYQIGKTGVENKLERTLRGSAGIRRIEVNSVGRVVRELDRVASASGQDLQLTLDNRLQRATLDRLGDLSASAVALDVRSGAVLAMASSPSFDPNSFVTGISVDDWEQLIEDERRPLLNKPVSGAYPPGSTFKMIVALAALESGVIGADERIACSGHVEVSNRKFYCWRTEGHGNVNLRQGLRSSCDVFFYEAARRVGIDGITAMARRFGLGQRHELPLQAIHAGLIPTRRWKRINRSQSWLIGDTLNVGIGQGFMLASPLQLAVMAARIATDRNLSPYLIRAVGSRALQPPATEPLGINLEHLNLVRRGMHDAVNHARGTAYAVRNRRKERRFAGKTGTSQVRLITAKEREVGVLKNEDLPWRQRDHALFVGYAPYEDPAVAIAVVAEHAGSGSAIAAPIFRDILRAAFDLGLTDGSEPDAAPSRSSGSATGLSDLG